MSDQDGTVSCGSMALYRSRFEVCWSEGKAANGRVVVCDSAGNISHRVPTSRFCGPRSSPLILLVASGVGDMSCAQCEVQAPMSADNDSCPVGSCEYVISNESSGIEK
jgi:hypothetical protein